MIKRMNKRGQGLTNEQLIGLLVVVVVGAVLVIGFVTDWTFFTNFFKKSNVDVAFLSQKCEGLLSSGNVAGFCNDKIEISSTSYMNCQYAIEQIGVTVQTKYTDCGLNNPTPVNAICNKLKMEQGDKFKPDKIKVNGMLCSVADPANFAP